jgi:aminoglycoside phosphotransferase (APT) family kinase protein
MRSALPPAIMGALDKLRVEAARYFGDSHAVIEPLELADREASHVLRAQLRSAGNSSRCIFVKAFKTRGPSADDRQFMRARVEKDFTVTLKIHEAFRAYEDLAVVRPIACFADELVLVTEEATGEPFHMALERSAVWQPAQDSLKQLIQLARGIGTWLRHFQAVDRTNRRVSLDDMREYLDFRLRRLVANPKAAFSEQRRSAVLSYFDARRQDVETADLTEVLVHGDLCPSNILVDGQRVIVIDFAMACRGGVYFDVARLFTQLDFLTAKPKFRPHVVAQLQAALLEGFDPALHPSNALFQLYELQHVICHVANLSLNPAPPVARLYNLYQLHRHRRWLRQRAA